MRVFNFNKVIYDGHATIDLTIHIIRTRFLSIFSLCKIIPYFVLFLFNRIHLDTLYNIYYSLLLNNLNTSELLLFKANNIHKVDLKGFGINSNDKKNLIITYEPSFIIDLFINRAEYNVLCVDYDPKLKKVINTDWLIKNKMATLSNKGLTYISELYIYSFKAKDIMNIAEYIFVYRGHELVQITNYKVTLYDKILYNITNFNILFYFSISFALLIIQIILAFILTLFGSVMAAWVFTYFLFSIATLYTYLKVVKLKHFRIKVILNHYLSIMPNFLFQLFFMLIFSVYVSFLQGLFLIIIPIIAFPLLIFVINFNKFD